MSDDIEDYQITPDDLGCGPEPECDPGVKEESGLAEIKVPIPKSFKHIPIKVKKRARKLYDNFEGDAKDLPFEEFCTELYALESPALMQADLKGMITEKHDRLRTQAVNMHAMKRSMN